MVNSDKLPPWTEESSRSRTREEFVAYYLKAELRPPGLAGIAPGFPESSLLE
jgi:hypothetical protein